jgi:hypothetical protein
LPVTGTSPRAFYKRVLVRHQHYLFPVVDHGRYEFFSYHDLDQILSQGSGRHIPLRRFGSQTRYRFRIEFDLHRRLRKRH